MVTFLHTCVYTICQELVLDIDHQPQRRDSWRDFFGYVLNAALAFLLVFRLNRAAGRFWTARTLWGRIVAKIRSLCGLLLVHGAHDMTKRDEALRWLAALALTVKAHIRGETVSATKETFTGILSSDDLKRIDANQNKALFVEEELRNKIDQIFVISDEQSSISQSIMYAQHFHIIMLHLDDIVEAVGGLERIKGTPLPMVYVSHLRTFLMLNLNLFPYVWGPLWGWATIGVVSLAAFALLGIEASGKRKKLFVSCRP